MAKKSKVAKNEQRIKCAAKYRELRIELKKTINATDKFGGPQNPFKQPQYLLLNLAIGGAGGNPSKTEFPSRYEIEYVRVYQKTGSKKAEPAASEKKKMK